MSITPAGLRSLNGTRINSGFEKPGWLKTSAARIPVGCLVVYIGDIRFLHFLMISHLTMQYWSVEYFLLMFYWLCFKKELFYWEWEHQGNETYRWKLQYPQSIPSTYKYHIAMQVNKFIHLCNHWSSQPCVTALWIVIPRVPTSDTQPAVIPGMCWQPG